LPVAADPDAIVRCDSHHFRRLRLSPEISHQTKANDIANLDEIDGNRPIWPGRKSSRKPAEIDGNRVELFRFAREMGA
jgi:hypothetical protein